MEDNKTNISDGEFETGSAGSPFFTDWIKDHGRVWTAPARFNDRDWFLTIGALLATGLLITLDESLYAAVRSYRKEHRWVDDVSPVVTRLGEGWVPLSLAGFYYLGGKIFKNRKAELTARLLLMTFLHTGIVVQAGKHLSGRQRPSHDDGNDHWHGPAGFFRRYIEEPSQYNSFPSGHTIVAWGAATVIAEMNRGNWWVPALCYSLAAAVGISRVTVDSHWFSDVFLGAVLGYAIGRFVVKRRGALPVITFSSSRNRFSLGLKYPF